jgi:hypothetical protein
MDPRRILLRRAALPLGVLLAIDPLGACTAVHADSCQVTYCNTDAYCDADSKCRTHACHVDADCGGRAVCASTGWCVPPCVTSADCSGDERCDASGACAAACTTAADCPSDGETCGSTGVCTAGCVEDSDCPSGRICAGNPSDGDGGKCVLHCTTDPDCANGERCFEGGCFARYCAYASASGAVYCQPQICSTDAECGAHASCGPGPRSGACTCEAGYVNDNESWQDGCEHVCVGSAPSQPCACSECECVTDDDCALGIHLGPGPSVCTGGRCQ